MRTHINSRAVVVFCSTVSCNRGLGCGRCRSNFLPFPNVRSSSGWCSDSRTRTRVREYLRSASLTPTLLWGSEPHDSCTPETLAERRNTGEAAPCLKHFNNDGSCIHIFDMVLSIMIETQWNNPFEMSSDILTARLESIYLMSNNTGENGTEC